MRLRLRQSVSLAKPLGRSLAPCALLAHRTITSTSRGRKEHLAPATGEAVAVPRSAPPPLPPAASPSASSSSSDYTSSRPSHSHIPPVAVPSSHDADLKEAFDRPHPPHSTTTASPPTGLFDYGPLSSPRALRPLTERTIYHARALVRRICDAAGDPSGRELRLVVKNLDRLSDLLCGVIDMAELVRNAHPDQRWVDESDMAYERLCSFMNELNTDTGLYEVSVPSA